MVWQGLQLKAVLVALAIGLVCLFGGQWLYNKYGYQQSLQQALAAQPQVADFKLEERSDQLVVTVRLRNPGNLQLTYKELRQAIGEALGSRPFTLELTDNRDAALEEVFYRSQFAIYQAFVQGSFEEMEQEVNAHARAAGAQARLYLDGENLYLTLTRGDRFLAAVIPRNPPQAAPGGVNPSA
ncbi:MAG: hypothetical protein AB1507_02055 [Bacillota bacterium]|nr:hypothetical protein [Thermoanaerobacteraceae bacterium]